MEEALLDIAHHERRTLSRQGHEMGLLELAHQDLSGLRVGDGAIVSHSVASATMPPPPVVSLFAPTARGLNEAWRRKARVRWSRSSAGFAGATCCRGGDVSGRRSPPPSFLRS